MTATPHGPCQAPLELLAQSRFEETAGWLLQQTGRWPKSARFSFATRVQDLVLDTAERLVLARYDRSRRSEELHTVNLNLERLRLLLRLARQQNILAAGPHEQAQRRIDEVGRLVHGWRRGGSA